MLARLISKRNLSGASITVGALLDRLSIIIKTWQAFCILRKVNLSATMALVSCAGLSVLELSARAQQSVTLGWEKSSDPDVVGYNIYFGTSSQIYTSKLSFGNVTNATITSLADGVTYYFSATTYDSLNRESAFCDEVVYTVAFTSSNQPPVIITFQGANGAAVGETVTFNVAAAGSGTLNYQWQFNGNNIASATSPTLALNNILQSQAGSYRVVVTNVYGAATSAPVQLTIASSTLVLATIAPVNGLFAMNVVGQTGHEYIVQGSTNLVIWIPVVTNTSPFTFVDADTQKFAKRFYRATPRDSSSTSSQPNDVTNGIFAYYPLASNGNDFVGGNNLTLAGFPSFNAGAVNWNGAVPTLGFTSPRQWPQSELTISAWINMADPNANFIIASCYGDSSGQLQQAYMQFFTMNGALNARLVQHIDADYIGRVSPANLTPGWHFVAFTWSGGTDSSSIKIYLDGTRVDEADANGGNFTGIYAGADLPLTVGAQFSDGWGISGKFSGQQKDLRIYARALSAEEIGSLESTGLGF